MGLDGFLRQPPVIHIERPEIQFLVCHPRYVVETMPPHSNDDDGYLPRSFPPIFFNHDNLALIDFMENRMLAQLSA